MNGDVRTPRPSLAPAAALEPRVTSSQAAPAATSLHIDRLVLDGFTLGPRERTRLRAAIESELRELMRRRAPRAASSGALAAVSADDVRLERPSDMQRLGRAIALSLHEAIAP